MVTLETLETTSRAHQGGSGSMMGSSSSTQQQTQETLMKSRHPMVLTRSVIPSLVSNLDASDVLECYFLTRRTLLHGPVVNHPPPPLMPTVGSNSTTASTSTSTSTSTTTSPPLVITKAALGFRFNPHLTRSRASSPMRGKKRPLALTLEYGPTRVQVQTSTAAAASEEGGGAADSTSSGTTATTMGESIPRVVYEENGVPSTVAWDNEAKVYYTTHTISATEYPSANYLASVSGAVLQRLLTAAVSYTTTAPHVQRHRRYQPFAVYFAAEEDKDGEDGEGGGKKKRRRSGDNKANAKPIFPSSSDVDFVLYLYQQLAQMGVALEPVLRPTHMQLVLHHSAAKKRPKLVQLGHDVSASQIAEFYDKFTTCLHALATADYQAYETALPTTSPTTVAPTAALATTSSSSPTPAPNRSSSSSATTNSPATASPAAGGGGDSDGGDRSLQEQEQKQPVNNSSYSNNSTTTMRSQEQQQQQVPKTNVDGENAEAVLEEEASVVESSSTNTSLAASSSPDTTTNTTMATSNATTANSNDNDTNQTSTTTTPPAPSAAPAVPSALPSAAPAVPSSVPSAAPAVPPSAPPTRSPTTARTESQQASQAAAQAAAAANQAEKSGNTAAAQAAAAAAEAAQRAADLTVSQQAAMHQDALLQGDAHSMAATAALCLSDPLYGLAPPVLPLDESGSSGEGGGANDYHNSTTATAVAAHRTTRAYLYWDGTFYVQLELVPPFVSVMPLQYQLPHPNKRSGGRTVDASSLTSGGSGGGTSSSSSSSSSWLHPANGNTGGDFVDWSLALLIALLFFFGVLLLLQQVLGRNLRIIRPLYKFQRWFFDPTHYDRLAKVMDNQSELGSSSSRRHLRQRVGSGASVNAVVEEQQYAFAAGEDVIPLSMGGQRRAISSSSSGFNYCLGIHTRNGLDQPRNGSVVIGSGGGSAGLANAMGLTSHAAAAAASSPSGGGGAGVGDGGDLEMVPVSSPSPFKQQQQQQRRTVQLGGSAKSSSFGSYDDNNSDEMDLSFEELASQLEGSLGTGGSAHHHRRHVGSGGDDDDDDDHADVLMEAVLLPTPTRFLRDPDLVDLPNLTSTTKVAVPVSMNSSHGGTPEDRDAELLL